MPSWKLTAYASKDVVEQALAASEAMAEWAVDIVLAGFEVSEDKPDDWQLDAYLPRNPTRADTKLLAQLFGANPPTFEKEALPDADWVTESQKGMDPIRAGRFHVRTPDHPADPDLIDLIIPASQAFGTGQHATTAGCLVMMERMRREGVLARHIIDVGTGTGLLAFAAKHLWPTAHITASDIDPVCEGVLVDNAELNGVALGSNAREVRIAIADGLSDPLLQSRGPYDLLIANILARPLIELSPDFADAVVPGGSVVLSGLLVTQEAEVRRAYRRAGFRLARRLHRGDWSILWLRRRAAR